MAVQRIYATVDNPTIEAIINGLFSFKDEEKARQRFKAVRDNYVLSKHKDDAPKEGIPDDAETLVLWIKGFEVTDEEDSEGFLGNYAVISCYKAENSRFKLKAEKIPRELACHPQKKRPKQRHPNWGHPILRGIKKGKVYATAEEAHDELMYMHEEYPDATIPGVNKLYLMIFSRADTKGGSPIQKFLLEVKPSKKGDGFTIEYKENKRPKKQRKQQKKKGGVKVEQAPLPGKFSSMVDLRRSRKKVNVPEEKSAPTDIIETTEVEKPIEKRVEVVDTLENASEDELKE